MKCHRWRRTMQIDRRTSLFLIATVMCAFALAAQPGEPCTAEFKGALLLSKLQQIGFSGEALRLLNGGEDPKLKRLLSWQFANAAADARRQIEEGAMLPSV